MITWNILRAAGIGAYVTLFLSVAWGLLGTTSMTAGKPSKQTAVQIHQFLSTVGLLLLAVHLGGLLVDSYMEFTVADLLLPLHGDFEPVATALGIVALYLLVIVAVASWVRRGMSNRFWRATHLLAIPTFTLAMLHGVFAGTDTVRPVMWGLYLSTGLTVVFLSVVRAFTAVDRRRAGRGTRDGSIGANGNTKPRFPVTKRGEGVPAADGSVPEAVGASGH